jgi:hypothetical protein
VCVVLVRVVLVTFVVLVVAVVLVVLVVAAVVVILIAKAVSLSLDCVFIDRSTLLGITLALLRSFVEFSRFPAASLHSLIFRSGSARGSP